MEEIQNLRYVLKRVRLAVILSYVCCLNVSAQSHMRIHYKGGEHADVPIEQIDSITFVNGEAGQAEEANITGSWLWADKEAGYYELLTFNGDNTYTGYDNYFTYGFDTMTYGRYALHGALLSLQSNGSGYSHRYTWYVVGLTQNALDVMTKLGRYTYYRLQPETIHLGVGETLACDKGDSFIFADDVMVSFSKNKLIGLTEGTTYVQKFISASASVVSYKVVVE